MDIFKGCKFIKHINPMVSGWVGWIENEQGNIIAIIKVDGRIEEPKYEEEN